MPDTSWDEFRDEELALEKNEEVVEVVVIVEPWWVRQDTTPFGGSL